MEAHEMESKDEYITVNNAEFECQFKKISQAKKLSSPSLDIRGILWNLMMKPIYNKERAFEFLFLCEGNDTENWSCKADLKLCLISRSDTIESISQETQHLFSQRTSSFSFIQWLDLINPDNGYTVDDSITFEVCVRPISDNPAPAGGVGLSTPEIKVRYTLGQISKITKPVTLGTFNLFNLSWKIIVIVPRNIPHSLGLFLQGRSNKLWSCNIEVDLQLMSSKKCQQPLHRKIKDYVSSETRTSGLKNFILWKDLQDESMGWIKDDAIIINARIVPKDVVFYEKSRSEATFRFTVENVSKMKKSQLSPLCILRNLPWKIKVLSLSSQTKVRLLGFFLQCNGELVSATWSCYAVAELRLLSCKEGQEPFTRKIEHLFCSEENDWGFSHFMLWKDVLDPDKGYIKDDSITLEVHVVAELPQGVNLDTKEN